MLYIYLSISATGLCHRWWDHSWVQPRVLRAAASTVSGAIDSILSLSLSLCRSLGGIVFWDGSFKL